MEAQRRDSERNEGCDPLLSNLLGSCGIAVRQGVLVLLEDGVEPGRSSASLLDEMFDGRVHLLFPFFLAGERSVLVARQNFLLIVGRLGSGGDTVCEGEVIDTVY